MVAFNIDEQAFRSVLKEQERQSLIEMIRRLLPKPPPRVRNEPSPTVKDYLVPKSGYYRHAILEDPSLNVWAGNTRPERVQFRECSTFVDNEGPVVCPCGEYRWTSQEALQCTSTD
jgi:hypothetical protein